MKPLHHDQQTTLITGASSGIGAEFARQLAARGSNLVLAARRIERLDDLATGLISDHGVRVDTVAIDLSQPAPGTALSAELDSRGIDITSVINNAGFGIWGRFQEADPERLREMITIDVTAVMDISRAFIPTLQAMGHGYLLNVASVAAYTPIPMMAAYSASKSFVLSLTEAIWAESRGSGLRVLAFSPGTTRTEFFDVVGTTDADGGSRYQTASEVVTTALRVLGRRNPPPSWVSGHLNHAITVSPRYFTRRRAVSLTAATTMRA